MSERVRPAVAIGLLAVLLGTPGTLALAPGSPARPSPVVDRGAVATTPRLASPVPPEVGPALRVALEPPPPDARFDYQIGADYEPPEGVEVVSRDWYEGLAPEGLYAICYVNGYQTQDDEKDVERPDERSNWPPNLVLTRLGDDPNWGGEYLIDISTAKRRARAAAWLEPMVRTCRDKGFEAVEFDNLDSWTRFDGTPVKARVPFGRTEAVAYAELLVDMAHGYGLAAAQKNTVQLSAAASRDRIGFDFAIAEECGRWHECQAYRDVFGRNVIVIEYRRTDFRRTCRRHGDALSVVLRDVQVTAPGSATYRYDDC